MSDNKSIIPAAFFQIGPWVSIDNNNFSFDRGSDPIMLCRDLSGDKILIQFDFFKNKKDEKITTEFVEEFFLKKQQQMVNNKEILKVKNFLEEDSEIEKLMDEMELGRKEEREWLKEKSEEIVLNNWDISSGKWMRGAISTTNKSIEIDGQEVPLFLSKTIIVESDGEPSKSGLYYITKTRHNIPVVSYAKNGYADIYLNKHVASVENFTSLISHSIRTAKREIDFLPEFFSRSAEWNTTCEAINQYKASKDYKRYIAGCEYILSNSSEALVSDVFIKLPKSLKRSFDINLLKSDSNSIINTLKDGIIRIYYNSTNDHEKDIIIGDFLDSFGTSDAMYGFYDIVSIGNEIEGNTYGFLTNNLNPRKVFFDISTIQKNINLLPELNSK